MRSVYSNAACTIAATASASSDGGLFFDRDPWLIQPRRFATHWEASSFPSVWDVNMPPAGEFWCDHESIWDTSINLAPLNKRGWVAQERHLSRRIMHFTETQLFWECLSCKANENYQDHLPAWNLSQSTTEPILLKEKVHQLRVKYLEHPAGSGRPHKLTSTELESLYDHWNIWKQSYSYSAVTKDEDRLIAIQGIAQDVGLLLKDHLVSGMWKSRILDEMCFSYMYTTDYQPRKTSNPSWSWASWISPICPESEIHRQYIYLTQVCSFGIKEGESSTIDASLLCESLRLRSNLIHAIPNWATSSSCSASPLPPFSTPPPALSTFESSSSRTTTHLTHMNLSLSDMRLCDEDYNENGHTIFIGSLDDHFVSINDRSADIFILAVRSWGSLDSKEVDCLLLAPHTKREGCFERIGYLNMRATGYKKIIAEYEKSASRVFTLL